MNIPKELGYTDSHLWININGDTATVGLTDFAQDRMGDILFIDLPSAGDCFEAGEVFSEVESSKSTQQLTFPFDIEVVEVNGELDDSPENINEDPYGAWIIKFTFIDMPALLDFTAYEEICVEE